MGNSFTNCISIVSLQTAFASLLNWCGLMSFPFTLSQLAVCIEKGTTVSKLWKCTCVCLRIDAGSFFFVFVFFGQFNLWMAIWRSVLFLLHCVLNPSVLARCLSRTLQSIQPSLSLVVPVLRCTCTHWYVALTGIPVCSDFSWLFPNPLATYQWFELINFL